MPRPDDVEDGESLSSFLEEPSDDLESWASLWKEDQLFPVRTHRPGLTGKIIVALKRLTAKLGPIVSAPQAGHWERQRLFNEVLIRNLGEVRRELGELADDIDTIGSDLQQVQGEILGDLREVQRDINGNVRGLSEDLDDFRRKGMVDLMSHTDALFARLDQKVDRLRQTLRRLDKPTVDPRED